MTSRSNHIEHVPQSASAVFRYFININFVYLLIPETFIWIIFRSTGIALSPAHKIFLLILTLAFLWIFRPYIQTRIFIITIILCISTVYTSVADFSLPTTLESLEDVTRLLLLFSIFYYFKILSRDGKIDLRIYRKFIWVSFIIILCNMVLGALGFGNEQRSGDIGTRGFFNAGNDISTVACVIAAFVLSEKFARGIKTAIPYLLIFLFFGYLLNTKAFIIGLVIIIAILPLYGHTKRFMSSKVFIRLSLFLMSLPFLLYGAYRLLDKIHFWDPYFAFIDQFSNDSWITFVLSRRDQHLINALNFASENFNFFHYLFGYSAGEFLKHAPARAEIDPFEIGFYFGIVGVLTVYGWFIRAIIKSYRIGFRRHPTLFPYHRGLFAANVFLFFQSIVSGHVFMSVLVCIYLGALNGIPYLNDE